MRSLLDLPPNLLDTVARDEEHALDDLRSLSLVHSALRAPAQRVLLSHLTIACDAKNHPLKKSAQDAERLVSAISTRSGRVGGFVARLTLDLRVPLPKVSRRQPVVADNVEDPTLTQTLKKALSCVTSAKEVYLRGAAVTADARSALSPSLTKVVLDFISRSNTLRTMSVVNVALPPSTIYALFRVAATKELTFFRVEVEGDDVAAAAPPPPISPTAPGSLDVVWAPKVQELLLTPELEPYAASLRRFTYYLDDHANPLAFLTASTLEELHLVGKGPRPGSIRPRCNKLPSVLIPPLLPSLRFFTVMITTDEWHYRLLNGHTYAPEPSRRIIWVGSRPKNRIRTNEPTVLGQILSPEACPLLERVTLRILPPLERPRIQERVDRLCIEETGVLVEELLGAHPRPPKLVWAFSERAFGELVEDYDDVVWTPNAELVEASMPVAWARRLVSVEYLDEDE